MAFTEVDYLNGGGKELPTTELYSGTITIPQNSWCTTSVKASDATLAEVFGLSGLIYVVYFKNGVVTNEIDKTGYNMQVNVDSNGYIQFKVPNSYWNNAGCFIL